ncbi:MAG: PQQ-binding-like beta-propeller repeat protein [Chthonomonadaceae bacterium]|nr:PQQ-binding-like beta-propeller repeat protein [Chthonomonadaceae bacterium]
MQSQTRRNLLGISGALLAFSAFSIFPAFGDDWTQWRGNSRDGLSKETGLLKSWKPEGPKLLWTAEGLGEGHTSPSVVKGSVYGMGLIEGGEYVWAVNTATGKMRWKQKIANGIELGGSQGGFGPRATPTIIGDKLYTLGVGGEAVCLSIAKGEILWHKNLVTDFGGRVPQWGYCESPLIDGEKCILTPGGSNTVIALNRNTGATIWKCEVPGNDAAHYSSAIMATVDGKKETIHFVAGGVVGISPEGKYLWRYNEPANRIANCSTPIYRDGFVFAASGYNTGGGTAKLTSGAKGIEAAPVYFTREMQNHHGGVVLVGDYLYGFDNSTLTCIDFKTGKTKWRDRSVGKGSVTYADGMLYARSEKGPVALVEANPEAYKELGRFDQPERSREPSWAYPVIADGKLYLHDQGKLFCYDVKK